MLVTFRIKDTVTMLHSKPAEISFRELASLMRKLHINKADLDVDAKELMAAPLNFEVNANVLSMAEFTTCFGHRVEIIAIVEEAQFLGRTLRIEHPNMRAPITMKVSEHIALGREMMMGPELAAKALYCLGRDSDEPGELKLHDLQGLLQDHRIHEAFVRANITPVYDSFSKLALTDCGDQRPMLEWSS